MKCVKNPATDEIRRVSTEEATKLIAKSWLYTSKGAWKSAGRPR